MDRLFPELGTKQKHFVDTVTVGAYKTPNSRTAPEPWPPLNPPTLLAASEDKKRRFFCVWAVRNLARRAAETQRRKEAHAKTQREQSRMSAWEGCFRKGIKQAREARQPIREQKHSCPTQAQLSLRLCVRSSFSSSSASLRLCVRFLF